MRARLASVVAIIASCAASTLAHAQPLTAPTRTTVDAVVVRFFAPETGGAEHPRFITDRVLAFEARLEAMQEGYDGDKAYLERHVRAAMEHHIAEEMLARLPLERGPSPQERARMVHEIGLALVTRIGGQAQLVGAAQAEGISLVEVDAMLRRQAVAAIYIDRAISPILKPSEDQLREVYRTAAHPYRGESFEEARADLERWFVAERLRVAKSAFLQTARTRVRIIEIAQRSDASTNATTKSSRQR